MDATSVLRSNLDDAHWILEQVVEGLADEHLHWAPPGTANTIAATYAHVIGSEDDFIQGTIRGQPLLAESAWVGRSGISLPIPRRGSDWYAWSRRVAVDLANARSYARAVYAASDAYLATLTPDQLGRAPDVPLPGNQPLGWLINNFLIQHAALHTGEIAVLKGLQGLHGYP